MNSGKWRHMYNRFRPPFDENEIDTNEPFTFFLNAMDDTNTETQQWDLEKRLDDEVRPSYWSYYVRMFGVNERGQSVSVYVNSFKPFLYVEAPAHWTEVEMRLALQHAATNAHIQERAPFDQRCIASVEQTWRVNGYGFTNHEKISMFKISFHNARGRKNLEKLLENCRTLENYNGLQQEFWAWDKCVRPLTQFNNVCDIKPGRWITIAAGQYKLRDSRVQRNGVLVAPHERRTREQIDIDCSYLALTCDHEREDVGKLLIESFDIEVAAPAGIFPDASKAAYPVIQVGSTAQRYGDPRGQYVVQCCFCLRDTANLRPNDMTVYCFETEAELLKAYYYYWTDDLNADIRLAYNQYGFDEPYLYNRYMKLLTDIIPQNVIDGTAPWYKDGALDYGKVRNERNKLTTSFTGSRAHGGRTKHTVQQIGRVQIDLMCYAQENWKLICSLNEMAERFLGKDEQKEDIHYTQITPLFEKDAQSRGKLASYCVRDTELPLMILDKTCVIIELIEAARLTGVTLDTLFNKKQTVRAETLLYYNMHVSEERYSIPEERIRFVKDPNIAALFRGEHGREGALVLEAEASFHSQPICVLDFAGLYPSIIRGWGLCYTTLILDPKYLSTTPYRHDVVRNKDPSLPPYNFYWALPQPQADGTPAKRPLLYRIITNILDARKRAKGQLKMYQQKCKEAAALQVDYSHEEFMCSVMDKRQLNLKIVANSQYGYTGIAYKQCNFSCPAIAITVTHYGRYLIETTRAEVHKRAIGSKCIYGDTDSVMIKFSEDNSEEAFRRAFDEGKRLAREITALFPPEVVLEFEKVYWPYMLVSQKRYAGIIYVDPDEKGKVKAAGMKSIKGDTIGFVKRVEQHILEMMLRTRSHVEAKQYLVDQLRQFVSQKVDPHEMTISSKMAKEIHMYPTSNQLATVAREMARRNPGLAPRAGDKVTFLHCLDKQNGNKPKAVDIDHYLQNESRYKINKLHYLDKLMALNLGRLFDLPNIAHDPYQWFDPFRRALLRNDNDGGIAKYLHVSSSTKNDSQDSFPLSMFKDGPYQVDSKLKRHVVEQTAAKHLQDECRRLEITIKEGKRQQAKRKSAVDMSQFFSKRPTKLKKRE